MRLNRFAGALDVCAAAAMILASAVLIWNGGGRNWFGGTTTARPTPPLPTAPVSLEGAWPRGRQSAALGLLIFSDFECPYCRAFARDTLPAVVRDFVDTGKARLAFRSLPLESLHPRAMELALWAECAGSQGRFWPMHDWLFAAEPAAPRLAFRPDVALPGVSRAGVEACISDPATRRGIHAGVKAAAALGIKTTPTTFVGVLAEDGRLAVREVLVGAQPYSVIAKALSSASTPRPR